MSKSVKSRVSPKISKFLEINFRILKILEIKFETNHQISQIKFVIYSESINIYDFKLGFI